ncbi:hypothetical protein VTK56DRAFT_2737 [Thermocarpiscus australiensis]
MVMHCVVLETWRKGGSGSSESTWCTEVPPVYACSWEGRIVDVTSSFHYLGKKRETTIPILYGEGNRSPFALRLVCTARTAAGHAAAPPPGARPQQVKLMPSQIRVWQRSQPGTARSLRRLGNCHIRNEQHVHTMQPL